MRNDINPIETSYKGYLFRSRLEARWAVFFDAMGIRFEYEPEGFFMPSRTGKGVHYLPDFFLPDINTYAEVKASGVPFAAFWKAALFATRSGRKMWFLDGPPDDMAYVLWNNDNGHCDSVCCAFPYFDPKHHTDDKHEYVPDWRFYVTDERCSGIGLRGAVEKSRRARFEHQETASC